jgi:hypothetical protein
MTSRQDALDRVSSFPVLQRDATSVVLDASGNAKAVLKAPIGQERRFYRVTAHGTPGTPTVALWAGEVDLAFIESKAWVVALLGVSFTSLEDVPFPFGNDLVVSITGGTAGATVRVTGWYQPIGPSVALWPEYLETTSSMLDEAHELSETSEDVRS